MPLDCFSHQNGGPTNLLHVYITQHQVFGYSNTKSTKIRLHSSTAKQDECSAFSNMGSGQGLLYDA